MTHPNAPLSETGRLRLARCVVEDGRRSAARQPLSAIAENTQQRSVEPGARPPARLRYRHM
jgi:hypothetical protein